MKLDCRPLIAEILEYQKELWERSNFCSCGADSLKSCDCSSEKKNRFLRRRKRMVNEKFSEDLDEALQLSIKSDETTL